MSVAVIIVAAGRGSRAGEGLPKQYRLVRGIPVLRRTLEVFHTHPRVDRIQVVIHEADRELYDGIVDGLDLPAPVLGGETRQESVLSGLLALEETAPGVVLIHDAARPFVEARIITEIVDRIRETGDPAIPALPVTDTLKLGYDVVQDTVSRRGLWRAQTPQGFPFRPLLDTHRVGIIKNATDDAALAEAAGMTVHLITGSEDNIKLTTEQDFIRAERFSGPVTAEARTGMGFDVHAFEDGDHVMLCGIEIPHNKTLVGHSDADVALHALTDAILGAMGAGDIGDHFPPSDDQWKGASSDQFLAHALNLVRDRAGSILNVDVTVIAETPKIAPHRDAMRNRVAEILQIAAERVSIKATTTEGLGYTGRGEGIAAQAVATLSLPTGASHNE